MDRLRPQIQMNPLRTGFLLGHILAHEMGHALQGISRHAETGVMKASWSLHETSRMWSHERLHFTSDDADLILLAFRSSAELANH
jgi:predicted Zn-dependent protease